METVFSALADLSSVIRYGDFTDDRVHFLHASLPDFLLDRTRSGQYHVDLASSQMEYSYGDKLCSKNKTIVV